MTTQEERKRKMLLFLPLLILPFLALGFYALGGGRGEATDPALVAGKGINLELPGAQLRKEEAKNKMRLYEQAQKDSAAARNRLAAGAFAALGWDTSKYAHPGGEPTATANEAKIAERLAAINKQINTPVTVGSGQFGNVGSGYGNVSADARSAELERLEKLLKEKQSPRRPDPEMQQLSGMLDKIMAIQNPGLVKGAAAAGPGRDSLRIRDTAFKAIPAVIEGNQKVAPGGVVKLRLTDSVRINGLWFAKGQLLFGSCNVTNQRLLLDIRNIRLGTAIVPVSLTVFSLDGMAGIAAPEAELSEAAGSGANGALESMQFLSMDNSLSTQAASAGISAAKSLLGKKVRKIRIKLKGGTSVLLRINKS